MTSIVDTDGYGYTYDIANYRPSGRKLLPLPYTWAGQTYPVTVTYVGGWAEIPGDLHEAYLDYIAWKWESTRGPGTEPGAQGPADEFLEGPQGMPPQVMEVIDGYRGLAVG